MVKVAVVFQSGKGHTKALADSVLKGVESVEGVNGCLLSKSLGPMLRTGVSRMEIS
jgi:hypothetical protein